MNKYGMAIFSNQTTMCAKRSLSSWWIIQDCQVDVWQKRQADQLASKPYLSWYANNSITTGALDDDDNNGSR